MNGLYPVFLALSGKKCLVVGGGEVAARKVAGLREAGAEVVVMSPQIGAKTEELVRNGAARWIEGEYAPSALDGAALVIAAAGDEAVNRRVSRDAAARNIPANVVDQPAICSFFVPSVVRRGDLVIAVSTSGKSPAVAKRLRKSLEKEFGPEWEIYLKLMGEARERAITRHDSQKSREKVFNLLADSALLGLVKENKLEEADKLIREIVGA